jgi:hypothetical protein
MKLIHKYEVAIEEYLHLDFKKFYGQTQEKMNYILGLTPQDPQNPTCIYFNAGFIIETINSSNARVFVLRTRTTFMIDNSGKKPTVDFLLPLVKIAYQDLCEVHAQKVKNTILHHHIVPVLNEIAISKNIQNCIEIWQMSIRNTSLN